MWPVPGDQPWTAEVNKFGIVGYNHNTIHIGYNAFGCSEARMIFEGSCIIAGIPDASATGDGQLQKRNHICSSSCDQLEAFHGWIVKLAERDIILMPTGFLTILAPLTKTYVCRWPVAADNNDKLRAVGHLTHLPRDYTELRANSTGYTQLRDFLQGQ